LHWCDTHENACRYCKFARWAAAVTSSRARRRPAPPPPRPAVTVTYPFMLGPALLLLPLLLLRIPVKPAGPATGGFCGCACSSSRNCSQSVLPGECTVCFPNGYCGGCDCACGGGCSFDSECAGECSQCILPRRAPRRQRRKGLCGVGCGGNCTVDAHCLADGCPSCRRGRCSAAVPSAGRQRFVVIDSFDVCGPRLFPGAGRDTPTVTPSSVNSDYLQRAFGILPMGRSETIGFLCTIEGCNNSRVSAPLPFGLFPTIGGSGPPWCSKAADCHNGGVAQASNLSAALERFTSIIPNMVPDPRYDGA
jgi:hypothetical protein